MKKRLQSWKSEKTAELFGYYFRKSVILRILYVLIEILTKYPEMIHVKLYVNAISNINIDVLSQIEGRSAL